jgi:hypothetical protein
MIGASPTAVRSYEELLNENRRWALEEGSRHFDKDNSVFRSLRKIAAKLNELGIPYAIAGGMALFEHGYRRFTDDVDILVTRESLREIHKHLDGLGFVRPFERSKNLKDAELGVRIEFLIAGDYPGDGKPKPVSFPKPQEVAVEFEGIKYVGLPALIELKLASGISHPLRGKDIIDVQELITALQLPADFATKLNPYVRGKYQELWALVNGTPTRYMTTWRNKFLTTDAKSLEEMILALRNAAAELETMQADGVRLDPDGGTGDDYAHLVTEDPHVARKYGMYPESEILDDEESAESESEK